MSSGVGRVPETRSETRFEDFKTAMSPTQAIAEANRCLYCADAPCIPACPTQINIPEFIRKITTGNLEGSARTIFSSNIYGMSCARVCPDEILCGGSCVFLELGNPPIQIGKLQRYATDIAYERGWTFFEAGKDSGKSVGLVGGGPASIAAAHALRRMGHAVTVYEKRDILGGLSTWGVAPYKLRADRAVEEVRWVMAIGGIEIRSKTAVGTDVTWDELDRRHDALFVGLGLGDDLWLNLPGADLDGVEGAVDYIERMKLGYVPIEKVRHAVVVGGGNTALDAVRETLGLGIPNVTLLYRRTESDMPGYAHEWREAKNEGARVVWRSLPLAMEGRGRVERVRVTRLDEAHQPIEGSEFVLDTNLVLMAIGQAKLSDLLSGLDGVKLENGCVQVDEHGATDRPGVFAGGDCVNGGKEVVNAVADGKAAATAIDRYLRGGSDA
ncbi:MAG: NAD(P)-dependent oxidoreductase [Myxococcota bacterium]